MAVITVGGVEYDIPKLKFRELRAAAPFIDRVLAARRRLPRSVLDAGDARSAALVAEEMSKSDHMVEMMFDTVSDVISIVAIGTLLSDKQYPYTVAKIADRAQELEGELDLGDELMGVQDGFDQIMREAGLVKTSENPTPPRVTAATVEEPPSTASTTSSPSSSLPDAQGETGIE